MNELDCSELHFLLDRDGAIIAFQEKDNSWAGALAFSNEERARKLVASSHLDVAEIASIATDDRESIATLVSAMKRRLIRYVLLDLDYHTGLCRQVEFEGESFGAVKERQFTAHHPHS